MSRQALKCTVTGRVQGVFYRARTSERALELGVDGWVRNQSDGSVELVACGEPESLERLIVWLWQGPPNAKVSSVSVEECLDDVGPGFRIVA